MSHSCQNTDYELLAIVSQTKHKNSFKVIPESAVEFLSKIKKIKNKSVKNLTEIQKILIIFKSQETSSMLGLINLVNTYFVRDGFLCTTLYF